MENPWSQPKSSYTPGEVAAMFGVKTKTVYAWLSRGEMRGNKNGYFRFITIPQIQEFIRNRKDPDKVDMTYANGPVRY
jgi:excisionase family DNA binding protein